jgi:hypothetical protein
MPRDSTLHAQHDPLLVVAFAAGDLTGTDRARAASLVADCNECATLHDDLLSIARATAALPSARRSRDFRLSLRDAAALRPAGWRRLVAAFAAPKLAFTRQLGVGLTTLGLAGVLFTMLSGISLPMGGSAAASPASAAMEATESDRAYAAPGLTAASAPAASAPSPAASVAPDAGVLGSPSDAGGGAQDRLTTAEPRSAEGVPDAANESDGTSALLSAGADDEASPPGVSLIFVASSIALAIGLVLLLVRRLSRSVTKG